MSKFDRAAPMIQAQQIPIREANRTTPDRVQNAFAVPMYALISGALVTLAVGLICLEKPAWRAGGWAILIMLILGTVYLWKEELVWTVENITGADINQDGWKGQPEPPTQIEIKDGNRLEFINIPPGTRSKLLTFARAVTSDNPAGLAERQWCIFFGKDRSGMDIYSDIISPQLEARGWTRWKNPHAHTLGRVLTPKGILYLEALGAGDPSPLLGVENQISPPGSTDTHEYMG